MIKYVKEGKEFTNDELIVINVLENHDTVKTAYFNGMYGMNARAVRLVIHSLRCKGIPVVTGDYGVKMADDTKEINECIKRLVATAKSINEAVTGLSEFEE